MTMLPLAAPALPLHTAGPYVAAAYIAFVVVVLVYVAIMAVRLQRTERELAGLRRDLEARDAVADDTDGATAPGDREQEPVA